MNVNTASILVDTVEWIMKESNVVVEDEDRDEGLDGGGTCPMADMTELATC